MRKKGKIVGGTRKTSREEKEAKDEREGNEREKTGRDWEDESKGRRQQEGRIE